MFYFSNDQSYLILFDNEQHIMIYTGCNMVNNGYSIFCHDEQRLLCCKNEVFTNEPCNIILHYP